MLTDGRVEWSIRSDTAPLDNWRHLSLAVFVFSGYRPLLWRREIVEYKSVLELAVDQWSSKRRKTRSKLGKVASAGAGRHTSLRTSQPLSTKKMLAFVSCFTGGHWYNIPSIITFKNRRFNSVLWVDVHHFWTILCVSRSMAGRIARDRPVKLVTWFIGRS